MADERIEALEGIGFGWDLHGCAWEERFMELGEYRRVHGTCNVPSIYPANQKLARWVKRQRSLFKLFLEGKNANANLDRVQQLSDIGFNWSPRRIDA